MTANEKRLRRQALFQQFSSKFKSAAKQQANADKTLNYGSPTRRILLYKHHERSPEDRRPRSDGVLMKLQHYPKPEYPLKPFAVPSTALFPGPKRESPRLVRFQVDVHRFPAEDREDLERQQAEDPTEDPTEEDQTHTLAQPQTTEEQPHDSPKSVPYQPQAQRLLRFAVDLSTFPRRPLRIPTSPTASPHRTPSAVSMSPRRLASPRSFVASPTASGPTSPVSAGKYWDSFPVNNSLSKFRLDRLDRFPEDYDSEGDESEMDESDEVSEASDSERESEMDESDEVSEASDSERENEMDESDEVSDAPDSEEEREMDESDEVSDSNESLDGDRIASAPGWPSGLVRFHADVEVFPVEDRDDFVQGPPGSGGDRVSIDDTEEEADDESAGESEPAEGQPIGNSEKRSATDDSEQDPESATDFTHLFPTGPAELVFLGHHRSKFPSDCCPSSDSESDTDSSDT